MTFMWLGCINSSAISNNAYSTTLNIIKTLVTKMGILLADESSGINANPMHVDDLDYSKAHINYIYQYNVHGLFCAR